MKRPNLASRNHCILASCVGAGAADCAVADGAQRVAAQIATAKVWANLLFTCVPRRFSIGAQPVANFNRRLVAGLSDRGAFAEVEGLTDDKKTIVCPTLQRQRLAGGSACPTEATYTLERLAPRPLVGSVSALP